MVTTDEAGEPRPVVAPLDEGEHQINQAAYLRLRAEIDAGHPKGRFVAIDGGVIVADAESFEAVDARLAAMGRTSRNIMVVLAGDDTPDFLDIL